MKTKNCFTCKFDKSIDCFSSASHHKDGLQSSCKVCISGRSRKRYDEQKSKLMEAAKEWKRNNPDKAKAIKAKSYRKNIDTAKNYRLETIFGISLSEYKKLLDAQGGVCKICGLPERATYKGQIKSLAVDHNHSTGQVRGLLCMRCNVEVGIIENVVKVGEIKNYLANCISGGENESPTVTQQG